MSSIDHIALYLLMYWLFVKYDKLSYRVYERTHLYDTKLLCILCFVLVEGLRYGRGRDYFHYGRSYLQYSRDAIVQPVYKFFQDFLYSIDLTLDFLPYGILFIVLSYVFIKCFFKYHESFVGKTRYFLLLGLLATQYIFEWTIRQGLSFGFLLVGIHFLEQNKKIKAIAFSLLGLSFHYGNGLFFAVVVIFFYCYNKKAVSLYVSIPILFVGSFAVDAFNYMIYVQQIISFFDLSFLGEGFATYGDMDRWFSKYSSMESMKRNFGTTMITTLFYTSVLILGYENFKKRKEWVYIYNTYVVFLLLYVPFYLNEILNRILFPATALWFIPVSLAVQNVPYKKASVVIKIAYIVFIAYLLMYYGRFVFLNPTGSYVWSMLPEKVYYGH